MNRVFRPRYVHGHRIHHGLTGMGVVAVGVALILHDWLVHGDSPLICLRDW